MTAISLDPRASSPRHPGRPLLRWLVPLVVLVLLAGAFVLLHHELRHYRYHDIVRAVRATPAARILVALGLTALAYLSLPGYDLVALRYIRRPIPLARVAFGSVIAYGLSQTLGFPLVTGGSVRYRFWSAWGLSADEIARAVSFASATFTLGLVLLGGLALVLEPASVAALMRLPVGALRPLGALCLALVGAYLAWSIVRRTPVRVRDWVFPVPTPTLALAQLGVAALDWMLAGSVLYALLPAGHALGFWSFLGAFLLAQSVGLVSHVPGGLGVFDSLMLLLLEPSVPTDRVLGTLIVYRAIYYLLPFAVAVALLASYEVARRHEHVAAFATGAAAAASRWIPAVLPYALSVSTFIGGAILLGSGATPSLHRRVAVLTSVLPLGVVELSHFTASLVGAGLIVLAWAIRHRLDAAYGLTIALLSVGIVASLLKGLDWEEALVLAVVLAAVIPARREFYRKTALTAEPLEPGWIAAVLAVVGVTLWLGFFSYKHVEYSSELWWRFSVRGDAPRFLRASVGALGAVFIFGMMRLLRHAEAEPAMPGAAELARAADIARASSDTIAYLALLGDKALLFGERGTGMLMYGVAGRSWVALGDPIGATAADRNALGWRFREQADEHGAWTVFYEVGTENLPLYIDLGLTLLKLGEEAVVPLDRFSLEGGSRKGLRRAQKDAGREGATFEVAPVAQVPALLPALRAISDAWLATRATREKGFSLGRFDEAYLCHFPMALVRVEGRIVAFANLWLGAEGSELSIDLMRHAGDAPPNVMDFLVIELMLWGKAAGYQRFNLGMAPLSGLENRALAPLWNRLGALLYRHGEHFYNFQGLRQYKEKFDPEWHPRYLASPGGLALPRILANVATLISGGITGVVGK